ncbi:MAG: ribosome silencing factor [Actinomycetota bacterium]
MATTDATLALEAARALSAKQAGKIVILDVSRVLVITDHFVIASGNTERQVRALASEVERRLQPLGVKPARREGEREGRWVVLDYVDFVVHLFHHEARDYYELERLWSDADEVPFEDDYFEPDDDSAAAQAT